MRTFSSKIAAATLTLATATACRQPARPVVGAAPLGIATLVADGNGVFKADSGWGMMDSAEVPDPGEVISQPSYPADGWFPATVPGTVLGGLAASGSYGDVYRWKNLAAVDPARFSGSWWFILKFKAPESFRGRHVFLHLDRVNYRANVWLDGKRVASSNQVAGTFRLHQLDVSREVVPGALNALAIEVFPPDLQRDLAISWVDWNPAAPDANMGIPGEVFFSWDGPVSVRFPAVTSALELPSLASAALTVRADLVNNTDAQQTATVAGAIGALAFSQEVPLSPRETRRVVFTPESFPQLLVQSPRVWWPAQLGAPELYRLSLTASVRARPSSRAALSFGIRTVTSELTPEGNLLFRVNGKRIVIRGAGWSGDLMLRPDPARLEAEIAYVKHLGLNAIRLEGHLESDRFFELCDEQGLLVIAGWQCCDAWQDWESWKPEQLAIAQGSMVDQARRLRSHPSVIDFLIGSDQAPPPAVEQIFVDALRDNGWPNPISPSAGRSETPLLGPSGVKMTGPYQWVAPGYWYDASQPGAAFGFNTETGPGAAIPKLPGLQKMLDPAEQEALWTDGSVPQSHAGQNQYADLSIFNEALGARYGRPADLADYVLKAQLMQYEAERALFEAYGRNQSAQATGVIHWKLNSAWPSLIWNLYDHDLVPAGAYFGVKKANEPLHIQYSYDDRSVVVVNHGPRPAPGLRARAAIYDLDGTERFSAEARLDVPEDGVQRALVLPEPAGLSAAYFVKLSLDDASGGRRSDNFYWLSTSPEAVDGSSERWFAPATLAFADFTGLRDLPMTAIAASGVDLRGPSRGEVRLTLFNPSRVVALFLQLELTRGEDGSEVAPALWEDNDVSLLPGETRTLAVGYRLADLGGRQPAVRLSGWNVPRTRVPLGKSALSSPVTPPP